MSGACFFSDRITASIQEQAPGTVVTLKRLRGRWPLVLESRLIQWGRPGSPPILRMEKTVLLLGFSKGLAWTLEGSVDRLDLAAFDEVMARGEWKASGLLAGEVRARGRGSRVEQVSLRLESQRPGGTLNSEVLQRLLALMPQDKTRGQLVAAIQSKPTFHFDLGKMEVSTEGPVTIFKFLLDGDHLLDITIRVSEEGLGVLKQLLDF